MMEDNFYLYFFVFILVLILIYFGLIHIIWMLLSNREQNDNHHTQTINNQKYYVLKVEEISKFFWHAKVVCSYKGTLPKNNVVSYILPENKRRKAIRLLSVKQTVAAMDEHEGQVVCVLFGISINQIHLGDTITNIRYSGKIKHDSRVEDMVVVYPVIAKRPYRSCMLALIYGLIMAAVLIGAFNTGLTKGWNVGVIIGATAAMIQLLLVLIFLVDYLIFRLIINGDNTVEVHTIKGVKHYQLSELKYSIGFEDNKEKYRICVYSPDNERIAYLNDEDSGMFEVYHLLLREYEKQQALKEENSEENLS